MQLRVMIEPQRGATYEDQLSVARRAEELGYAAIFRSDHFMAFGDEDPGPGPTDSWVTLAGLARETRVIRLGTMVTSATFRLPGMLAVQVAQVDAMSGGRVELGLGAGWFEAEHQAYGVPFPTVGERFERLEEQLAIVTGMWQQPKGERFNFEGRYYGLSNCPALPKPVQVPRPPIVVGGMGPRRTPHLAAAFADELNAGFAPMDEVGPQLERGRKACAALGRDPSTLVMSIAATLVTGKTGAEVKLQGDKLGADLSALEKGPGLVGTPEQLVDRLHAYAQMGVSRAYLQLLDMADLAQLELVAAEVMPHV